MQTQNLTARLVLITTAVALAVASSALLWAGQAPPRPRFTTPSPEAATNGVNILGEVKVGNTVSVAGTVTAEQAGLWTVQLGAGAKVALASPAFLQANTSYEITWSDGGVEDVHVLELKDGGWVVGDSRTRGRGWVNLAHARAIRRR